MEVEGLDHAHQAYLGRASRGGRGVAPSCFTWGRVRVKCEGEGEGEGEGERVRAWVRARARARRG